MVKTVKIVLVFVLLCIFYSYRILQVPSGLTADEGAFAYNAVLLSRTLHDENGRFMPFFVLSLNGTDWRQPVTQYYLTALFKILPPDVFTLRFSSVLIASVSVIMVWGIFGIVPALLVATTPLLMIQAHMGLDNIMPVPFTLLWVWGLMQFKSRLKFKYLVLSAIALGISFYSYKGMRAIVPVWSLLSVMYLWPKLKSILVFSLSLFPFFAIIPWLQAHYPGAVFGGARPVFDSYYNFFMPYLSSFDPSFLFVTGDATRYHSTGMHGMFLLASLPIFVLGIFQAVKKRGIWTLILAAFFLAPLLYGSVGSVHRASRLMNQIPLYAAISGLGLSWLWSRKKIFGLAAGLLLALNYFDFVNYYWYTYPKFTRGDFGDLSTYLDFKEFSNQAKKLNLQPYVYAPLLENKDQTLLYYAVAYLSPDYLSWSQTDGPLPEDALLLSNRKEIPGTTTSSVSLPHYYLSTMVK